MVEIKKYVVGFLFNGDDVLLLHKSTPVWQRGKINGVGGKIEPGETPHDAMVREFREETTLHIPLWQRVAELNTPTSIIYFFKAHYEGEKPIVQGLEEEPVEWFDRHCLPHNVVGNLRWVVPMAFHKVVDKAYTVTVGPPYDD